jgi:cell division protein ZapA (FtsZ GTPase activity inhibitor)
VKHNVTLEIAGTRFRLVADAEESHLQRLAALVNERVDELKGKSSRVAAPAQLLALVALGLADDLLCSQEKENRVRELTRTAVASAIERIDRRIASDAERAEE